MIILKQHYISQGSSCHVSSTYQIPYNSYLSKSECRIFFFFGKVINFIDRKNSTKAKAHRVCTKVSKRTDKSKCWILIAKSFRFTFISQSSQDKSYRQFSTNRASTKGAITVLFFGFVRELTSPKWGLTLPTFHLS